MKPELFYSLKNYKKNDIFKDLLAGLMVAIVALPLSIALGIQSVPNSVSSHGIQMGIVTAIIAGFFISALGGSRFQIGGPTAAFVVILYSYLANPQIGLLGLAIAGVMAGVLLIIMGLCKVGSVMKFFPYPIIIGFTTGIGITLMIGQIKDLCGFNAHGSETMEKLFSYFQLNTTIHLPTFIIGIVGFLLVFFLPKISKKIPSALIALVVCTLLCGLFNSVWDGKVATIIGSRYGEISAGFFLPDFAGIGNISFTALILPCIVITFLCAIESLLSASVASGLTNTTFNPNQELFGQGVANIFSSLFGGLPATGAIARTVTGIENGAKSPLSGMFHAIFVLIMYFALMNVLKYIPLAVFSSILIVVAINMSRFKLFFKLMKFGIRDTLILLASCILTVVFDLTYGVMAGILVALLSNIKNFKTKLVIEEEKNTASKESNATEIENATGKEKNDSTTTEDKHTIETKKKNSKVKVENISEESKTATEENLVEKEGQNTTYKLTGTLYFVNINKLTDKLERELANKNKITLDFKNIDRIDQSALEKIAKLSRKAKSVGKTLELINYNQKVENRINNFFTVL